MVGAYSTRAFASIRSLCGIDAVGDRRSRRRRAPALQYLSAAAAAAARKPGGPQRRPLWRVAALKSGAIALLLMLAFLPPRPLADRRFRLLLVAVSVTRPHESLLGKFRSVAHVLTAPPPTLAFCERGGVDSPSQNRRVAGSPSLRGTPSTDRRVQKNCRKFQDRADH